MNTEVCIVNNASLRAGTLLMIPTWAPSVTTTVQILLCKKEIRQAMEELKLHLAFGLK